MLEGRVQWLARERRAGDGAKGKRPGARKWGRRSEAQGKGGGPKGGQEERWWGRGPMGRIVWARGD